MDVLTPAQTDKKTLRRQMMQKRQLLPDPVGMHAALELAQHVLSAIPSACHVVAGYSPTRGELDIFPALMRLAKRGHQLCLPVVNAPGSPLIFRHWQPGEPLEKAVYNISVPSNAAPILQPDAVLVPMVAFDSEGYRLGYGGGYYDRTLQEIRTHKLVQAIGIGYAMQQTDRLVHEAHDQKLDMIITEEGVLRF